MRSPTPDADELLGPRAARPRRRALASVATTAPLAAAPRRPRRSRPRSRQVDDRVGDELARAVVGRATAAVGLGDVDAARRERCAVGQLGGRVGATSRASRRADARRRRACRAPRPACARRPARAAARAPPRTASGPAGRRGSRRRGWRRRGSRASAMRLRAVRVDRPGLQVALQVAQELRCRRRRRRVGGRRSSAGTSSSGCAMESLPCSSVTTTGRLTIASMSMMPSCRPAGSACP